MKAMHGPGTGLVVSFNFFLPYPTSIKSYNLHKVITNKYDLGRKKGDSRRKAKYSKKNDII